MMETYVSLKKSLHVLDTAHEEDYLDHIYKLSVVSYCLVACLATPITRVSDVGQTAVSARCSLFISSCYTCSWARAFIFASLAWLIKAWLLI